MLEKLYAKTGIKLTERQVGLLRQLMYFLGAMIAGGLVLGGTLLVAQHLNPECGAYSQGYHLQIAAESCYASTSSKVPLIGLGFFGIIVGINGLRLLISVVMYVVHVLTDQKFRETEIAQSVSFMEADEREQLITLNATRRAYMVLNFTLLVGWFISLISGHLSTAFLLFIIQLIGTLSYRKQALG